MRLLLADAVNEPLTGEDGTYEDVDPEEGHEDNLTTSRWVMLKNSHQKRPRLDTLVPSQ